jgi:hypothetical protein
MTIDAKELLKLKEDVRNLVSEAGRSADKIINNVVPSCDTFSLSFLLGDTEEARGAAGVLARLYPEDKEIKQMFKDAAIAHILAYKGRDSFMEQCKCEKKFDKQVI